jgi:hypothetical protein
MTQPGSRVGAIRDADQEIVHLFGYGIYEGDFELPDDVQTLFGSVAEMRASMCEHFGYAADVPVEQWKSEHQQALKRATTNPRIRLDDGNVVLGCQCWWALEEQIKTCIGSRKVEIVPTPKSKPSS